MKKFFLSLLMVSLIGISFTGCYSTKSVTSTKSNTGYIQLVGNKQVYTGTVIITIDDKASYEVDVNSDTDLAVKNPATYGIAPGAHFITVEYDGTVVVSKKVFITAQQISVVELP